MGLLLDVLPEVAKEKCDLTYVEIAERKETLDGINAALNRIKGRIEALRPSIRAQHKDKVCKLQLGEQ